MNMIRFSAGLLLPTRSEMNMHELNMNMGRNNRTWYDRIVRTHGKNA